MKKTLLSLLIILFIISITCLGFAQPMEEEEDPIQARPSPVMKQEINSKAAQTKKGAVMQQQKLSNKSLNKANQLKGKAQIPSQQQQMNTVK